MKQKWPLFTGIILLTAGIILKKTTELDILSMILMTVGVSLKVYYIVDKARKGIYKPGSELWALFIGLILFFSGIYLKNTGSAMNHLWLMVPGISLKVLFVILFVRKTRKTEIRTTA